MDLKVKQLLLQDFTEEGKKYCRIVSATEHADVLSLQYEDFAEAQNGFNSSVAVKSGSLELVYLNRWKEELVGFVEPITEATSGSKAKQVVEDMRARLLGTLYCTSTPLLLVLATLAYAPPHGDADDFVFGNASGFGSGNRNSPAHIASSLVLFLSGWARVGAGWGCLPSAH